MNCRRFMYVLFACLLSFVLLQQDIKADIGPHEFVEIEFCELQDQAYCVTLLSEADQYGPYHTVDIKDDRNLFNEPIYDKAFDAFLELDDSYYFLQYVQTIDQTNNVYKWAYMPPQKFKVAVYDPVKDKVYVSDIVEQYGFENYFKVNGISEELQVQRVNSFSRSKQQVLNFIERLIATVLIEVCIAWLFKIRDRKSLKFIAVVNAITQLLLNLSLLYCMKYGGYLMAMFVYIPLEILVVVIEVIAYVKYMEVKTNVYYSHKMLVTYGIVANVVTYLVGVKIIGLLYF